MARIKLGLVGLNFGLHILKKHLLEGPGQPYFQVAGVCSQDQQQTIEVAGFAGVRAYSDIDEMLADTDVRAIGLFSGPVGRAELIRQAIRAGKDVITTKPFELDPDAALDVLEEARQLKRIVHLNSPTPLLSEDLRQIIEWHQAFDLGRPVGCRAEVWANYRERADGSWYDDPMRCPVAPVFRLGIYVINDLVRLFGPASKVQVLQSRIFTGRPTPDNAQLTVLFANGAIATVFASFCVGDGDPYRNSLTLNYERGSIYRDPGPLADRQRPGWCELALVTKANAQQRVERTRVASFTGEYQWKVFFAAITGAPLPEQTAPEHVVHGLKIIQAMHRAERSGTTETV